MPLFCRGNQNQIFLLWFQRERMNFINVSKIPMAKSQSEPCVLQTSIRFLLEILTRNKGNKFALRVQVFIITQFFFAAVAILIKKTCWFSMISCPLFFSRALPITPNARGHYRRILPKNSQSDRALCRVQIPPI